MSRVSPTRLPEIARQNPAPTFSFEFRLPGGGWELSGAKPLPEAEAHERLARLSSLPGEFRLVAAKAVAK